MPDAAPDADDTSVAWLRRPAVRLLLTSTTLLFVELLLIRWIPSQVRYVGFFSNFLLMASFLGIGLGILLGRRGARWSLVAFPLLLLLLMALVVANTLNVEIVSQQELFFGLADHSADTRYEVLILVVALVTAVMAALAMPLGPLLRSMPPLRAYAIDIGGSMVGIVMFTVLSAAGTDPLVWFSVAAVLTGLLVLGANIGRGSHGRWSILTWVAILGVVGIAVGDTVTAVNETWSPYYRITTHQDGNGETSINVNGIPHQALHPVTAPKEEFYEQVYHWFPGRTYDDVLIVGAGSGSDVALALARGAKHVDAVEIDPAIQRLGIEQHPDQPVPGSAGHAHHQRRSCVPARHGQTLRPDHLRPARLADPGEQRRERAPGELPVHRAGVRVDPRPPRRRRRVRALQLLPRGLAGGQAREDAPGRIRARATAAHVRPGEGDPRGGTGDRGARRGAAAG